MRIIYILILTISVWSSLYCQVEETEEMEDIVKTRNTLILKTAPLGYTNYFVRRVWALNLGFEYKLNSNWSIYFEGSLPSKSLKYVRPEIKYFFIEKESIRKYVSIEYSYIEQHFQTGDSIGYGNAYYKNYSMSKYLNTLKIKYGWHRDLGSNLSLDSFIGVGIRKRNGIVKGLTEDEIDDREIGSPERHFFLDHGEYYVPNIAIGIRLSYAIL